MISYLPPEDIFSYQQKPHSVVQLRVILLLVYFFVKIKTSIVPQSVGLKRTVWISAEIDSIYRLIGIRGEEIVG